METNQQSEFQERDQPPSTQQNQIKLVPFVELDGEWILSDGFLDSIFDKIVEQGLLKTTFWEGNVTDHSHFESLAKSSHNHMLFFFEDTNCVGFAWLSSVTTNYAFAHFCMFREIWGRAVDVGKTGMDYWFSWPGTDGPLLDVIVGIMPGFNKHAHKFVESLGWTRLGVIPGMFRDQNRNREDAVIYYRGRDG